MNEIRKKSGQEPLYMLRLNLKYMKYMKLKRLKEKVPKSNLHFLDENGKAYCLAFT
jgi:hypothetical protein